MIVEAAVIGAGVVVGYCVKRHITLRLIVADVKAEVAKIEAEGKKIVGEVAAEKAAVVQRLKAALRIL